MTLTIGVAASLFTALVVTRLLFNFLVERNILKTLWMMHIIKNPKVDFMAIAKPLFVVTWLFVVVSLGFGITLLLDAADDLGVNYAPKLANMGISCPACVQTVHLVNPPASHNDFGPAPISFAGAPDFSPTRIATPGPDGFPLTKFQPGAVAGPGTPRSSRSPGRTPSTTRRSWPPETAPSTW